MAVSDKHSSFQRTFAPLLFFSLLRVAEPQTVSVSFKTTNLNTNCADNVLRYITQVSLDECVVECMNRPGCRALHFRRRFSLCMLFDIFPSEGSVDGGSHTEECALVKKADMQYRLPASCDDCTEVQTCDLSDGSCTSTECSILTIPSAVIQGNMRNVGARVKYTCHQSKYDGQQVSGYVLCLSNGTWIGKPNTCGDTTCLKDDTCKCTCMCPKGFYGDDCSLVSMIALACENDQVEISCGAEETIKILSANFGRTADSSVCPHSSIRTSDCYSAKSYSIVSATCDGQQTCQVDAVSGVFGGDPCGAGGYAMSGGGKTSPRATSKV